MEQSIKDNKKTKFAHQRLFARLSIKIPLRFSKSGQGEISVAETVDISAKGVGFISKTALSPNMPLEIWLDMPDHHRPLYITGKVIWSKNQGGKNKLCQAGVQFKNANLMDLGRIYR